MKKLILLAFTSFCFLLGSITFYAAVKHIDFDKIVKVSPGSETISFFKNAREKSLGITRDLKGIKTDICTKDFQTLFLAGEACIITEVILNLTERVLTK